MTLRLDDMLADQVELIATVDSQTVADVQRQALLDYIERRRADAGFQENLRTYSTRVNEMLQTPPQDTVLEAEQAARELCEALDDGGDDPEPIAVGYGRAATVGDIATLVRKHDSAKAYYVVMAIGRSRRQITLEPLGGGDVVVVERNSVGQYWDGNRYATFGQAPGRFERVPGDEQPLPFTGEEGS